MKNYALTIGYAFPRDAFAGEVHSVFANALNLHLRSGEMVTLCAKTEDDLPQGVRIATPPGFSFVESGLFPRQPVTCQDGLIYFQGAMLRIDLHTARLWRGNLANLGGDLLDPGVQTAYWTVWNVLNERQRQNQGCWIAQDLLAEVQPQTPGLVRQAWGPAHRLLAAVQLMGKVNVGDIEGLIGLGPGLTPSGDDFLAGLLLGLWSTTGADFQRRTFLSGLAPVVLRAAERTNEISRAYLLHAAGGQAPRRMYELARAICAKTSTAELYGIAEKALNVGHTSGMDGVTGLLAGMKWSRKW